MMKKKPFRVSQHRIEFNETAKYLFNAPREDENMIKHALLRLLWLNIKIFYNYTFDERILQ